MENKQFTIDVIKFLPALRMMFSEQNIKVVRSRTNSLIQEFIKKNAKSCESVIYLKQKSPDSIIKECAERIKSYKLKNVALPKFVALKNFGLLSFDKNVKAADVAIDVFEQWLRDNQKVTGHKDELDLPSEKGKVGNKIAIITGGAQGIGFGIAEGLFKEGANVVIADFNEERGKKAADILNQYEKNNKALFIKTDITDNKSVESLIRMTVESFGGLDILISNAGILFAGSLEEMTMETFEKVTQVNYSAYFLCTKYASEVLKIQAKYKDDYFTDIIQINSKSGLKGSNKNFAYAGSKFGGIGLTQSFALELMPYRIKVNSICPGNFFELPLWSDPDNGLFVQYLRTGKVPGAKNTDDVRKHYEKQVPAGRGCEIKDLLKAIFYVIDQEYETGQAVPVTGGQEMLR